MAQYATDFSDQTAGQPITGWTDRWHDTNTSFTAEDVSGTIVARLAAASTARAFRSWDAINADPDRGNVEICVKWRTTTAPSAGSLWPARVRGSGDANSETAYSALFLSDGTTATHKYVNASVSSNISAASFTPTINTVYRIILGAQGTTITLKVALESDPSTLLVNLSGTDASITAAGWVGVGAFSAVTTQEFLFVGVGTDGDQAPTDTGSATVSVGTATETSAANTISSGEVIVAVGTATESDSGNAVTPPVVKGASVTLYNGSTPQANITNITAMWWDSSPPTGNPVFTTSTASTDASGKLTVDLDSTTALPIGDPGHLSAYKLDGTDEKDSLAWQGRLLVEGIN